MTKIDIISGFLGAGKTTLIKKLLSEALKGQQVVLIENEFGEIGIDGGFLKESGIEIREMNSGCICCSLVGDFGTSLKEVIDTYHPDRIVIEPSGVGKLSDVIKAVKNVKTDCEISLNSYTTVVDVNKCKMYMRNFGEFFENQLEYAKTIILSRTDTPKATDEKVEQAVELIRGVNKDAVIITTPIEKLEGSQILEAMEQGRQEEEDICPVCGGAHGHEGHDHEHSHDHEDHDHEHSHDHGEHDHDATTTETMIMSIATTTEITTMTTATITEITIMNTAMITKATIMTMTADAATITATATAVAAMTTIITITTMRTRCSPAGAGRLRRSLPARSWRRC